MTAVAWGDCECASPPVIARCAAKSPLAAPPERSNWEAAGKLPLPLVFASSGLSNPEVLRSLASWLAEIIGTASEAAAAGLSDDCVAAWKDSRRDAEGALAVEAGGGGWGGGGDGGSTG